MPKKYTTEEIVARARAVHGNLYDYSELYYTGMTKKVKIIDPDYGEFWQTPFGHIIEKQGNPLRGRKRAADKRRHSFEEFVNRAREKHGDLYNYSKVKYKHVDEKVLIIDPEYGEFWQTPYQHLNSHGCPERSKRKKWVIHKDHIIPLSIIHSSSKMNSKWNKERPLYKFLNSEINIKEIPWKENIKKSDTIIVNDKTVSACSVRNNYLVIEYLIRELLNVDPTEIIKQDREYIKAYLGFK